MLDPREIPLLDHLGGPRVLDALVRRFAERVATDPALGDIGSTLDRPEALAALGGEIGRVFEGAPPGDALAVFIPEPSDVRLGPVLGHFAAAWSVEGLPSVTLHEVLSRIVAARATVSRPITHQERA